MLGFGSTISRHQGEAHIVHSSNEESPTGKMSFEIGILSRAANVARRVRFGPKRPRYYGWATHTPTPYVFRCAGRECSRVTDTIWASVPDDAEYLVERAGWRLSRGGEWSCPYCAGDASAIELQVMAASAHGESEIERAGAYKWPLFHAERLTSHREERQVYFLACWSLRFSEPEPEPWA